MSFWDIIYTIEIYKTSTMSKKEYLWRYLLIIKKLKKYPVTWKDIRQYLKTESEIQDHRFDTSLRTFQRDLKEIRSIFGIDIRCNRSDQTYSIDPEGRDEAMVRMLEALDTLNALKMTDSFTGTVYFEKRRPQGTENMYGLLHAITNKLMVEFNYLKFWDELPTHRKLEPYALKEFENRWYVIGLNLSDLKVKTFGLDRISDFVVTPIRFSHPREFKVDEHFRNCFGIIGPTDQELHEVILSFTQLQGKYIKSLPLHESQEILIDNEKELRIKLRLYLTYDFIMEVLKYGPSVKVIQPESLIEEVKTACRESLAQYSE